MHLRSVVLAVAATLVLAAPIHPAGAASYDLADLRTLVDRNEFMEAVAHLRDVPPRARTAAWDDLAVRALVGAADMAERSDPGYGFFFLREQALQLPSVGKDPRIGSKVVELGLATIKRRRLGSNERVQEVVNAMLEVDPSSIVPLVTEARYRDPDRKIFQWIHDNPDSVRSNATVKAMAFNDMAIAFNEPPRGPAAAL